MSKGWVTEEECMNFLEAYKREKLIYSGAANLGMVCGEQKWKRPVQGRNRVDVDVLFNREKNNFGLGVIVMNLVGIVKVAMRIELLRTRMF